MKKQSDRNWLIFLVQINQEIKIADQLIQAHIQCCVPTQPVLRRWGNKEQWVTKIITPRMIFAYVHEDEHHQIMNLPFKINYLRTKEEKPATIPEEHIQALTCILNQKNIPIEFPTEPPAQAIRSRITRGPLKDMEGLFHTIDQNSYLSIPFNPLGYIRIPIQPTDLEPVNR